MFSRTGKSSIAKKLTSLFSPVLNFLQKVGHPLFLLVFGYFKFIGAVSEFVIRKVRNINLVRIRKQASILYALQSKKLSKLAKKSSNNFQSKFLKRKRKRKRLKVKKIKHPKKIADSILLFFRGSVKESQKPKQVKEPKETPEIHLYINDANIHLERAKTHLADLVSFIKNISLLFLSKLKFQSISAASFFKKSSKKSALDVKNYLDKLDTKITELIRFLTNTFTLFLTKFGELILGALYAILHIPVYLLKFIFSKKFIFAVLLILFIATLSAAGSFWYYILRDLPDPNNLNQRNLSVSTKIYDRDGELLYQIYKDENRSLVKLADLPDTVIYSTLAAEDAEFFDHPGVSFKGITRATIKNITEGKLTGGSTITQQLIKNTLLTPEKTIQRKLKEVVLALEVEQIYSKQEILEMYLNEVSYGSTAYGIKEAANLYFNKNPQELTLAEAAYLAGLTKSPSTFSPYGNTPELGKARQKDVLFLMQTNGFISGDTMIASQNQKLIFSPVRDNIKAPHFVMYTKALLEEKYGSDLVETGGLEVTTTLDYDIQQLAEKAVAEEIEKLKSLNVTNAAVVVLNPQNGEILAMVGSVNYFDIEHDGNVNAAVALRQPGSSIKVVNYANALSSGMTPATMLEDTPVTFEVEGQPPYSPKNYDDRYRGRLTLRSALAESRNVPAVKVLNEFGVDKMIDLGQKMGITTWDDRNRFGLSLTLGGGEVKLIELAQVYATLANYGLKPSVSPIVKITDFDGTIVENNTCKPINIENKVAKLFEVQAAEIKETDRRIYFQDIVDDKSCQTEKVLDPKVAYQLTDILKDNDARSPAFGRNSQLVIPGHKEVAVKTGTSNNLRDNLTVGYNQDFLVAVWVGNNDNTPMNRVASGLTGASPIFNKIMSALLANRSNHDWEIPNDLISVPICSFTGTLACNNCPTKEEWFVKGTEPTYHCNPDSIIRHQDSDKDE